MKKNNIFFYSLLFIAFSCNQKKTATLLSKWDTENNKSFATERLIASAVDGQCFRDTFSVETLKQEIYEIEKKFTKSDKVSGKWRHIDLSTLPVPQANFLKTYGESFGDLTNKTIIDYAGCEDVPCLFNRIYGKENYVAGYVHYLWYLKLGHRLSADNKVPDQKSAVPGEYNGKAYHLSDYLFSKNELYGLWRTTFMLKAPHTNLLNLKEVQRLPRGAVFEGENFKVACGLASSAGYIILSDQCLTLSSDLDGGFLYEALIHELSHHVDFQQGSAMGTIYRSHKADYLNVSGWVLNEYVDTAGVTHREWKLKEYLDKDGLTQEWKTVSAYARTNPQENFADSLTLFKVEGDNAKRDMNGEHYSFVSDEYYNKNFFDKKSLVKSWINSSSLVIDQHVIKATLDCGQNTPTGASNYFGPADFSSSLSSSMMMCFGMKASEISTFFKAQIALTKAEGCKTFKDSLYAQALWDSEMKKALTKAFVKSHQAMLQGKEQLAKDYKYSLTLSDKTIARDAFVECYAEKDEIFCYKEQIQKSIHAKASELKMREIDENELLELYLSYHLHSLTRDAVQKNYQNLIVSNLDLITLEARNTWKRCLGVMQDDSQPPTGTYFIMNKGYMISSVYNCLNNELPDSIKRAARSISVNSMRVQDAKEELILFSEVRPHILNIIRSYYETERDNELKLARLYMARDDGKLRNKRLSSFKWVKNVSDAASITADCKAEAVEDLNFRPYFHTVFELFGKFIDDKVCFNIERDPIFKSWVESSEQVFKVNVLDSLEDQILKSADKYAVICRSKFPMDTTLNKIRYRTEREACLMSQWDSMEDDIIKKVLSDPMAHRSKVTKESLKSKIDLSRRRIQLKVMKERFQ